MTTIRPIFGVGRVRVSRIVYYRDLADAASKPIPLGVMCDFTVGEVYGLSLMARRKIPAEELATVGVLMRRGLAQPFDMLKSEFHWIWEQTGRRALALNEVVQRHTASLRFTPLSESRVTIPRALKVQPEDIEDLSVWVRDELSAKRNTEYWSLMGEQLEPTIHRGHADLKKRGTLIHTEPPTKIAA